MLKIVEYIIPFTQKKKNLNKCLLIVAVIIKFHF